MTREELEETCTGLYSPVEVKCFLKGFDVGYAQALKIIKDFLEENKGRI